MIFNEPENFSTECYYLHTKNFDLDADKFVKSKRKVPVGHAVHIDGAQDAFAHVLSSW